MKDNRLIDGIGLWFEQFGNVVQAGRPALLLDRDGVIVDDVSYLCRAEDVRIIDGASTVIRWANCARLPVVMVTNQAGIGRGYYDWAAFQAVQDAILSVLAREGAHIDLVLACAFHEDGKGAFSRAGHPWRKPNPGMIHAAQRALDLNLAKSLIIGDKLSDIDAGYAAGVGYGVLIGSDVGRFKATGLCQSLHHPMCVMWARSVSDALEVALSRGWTSSIP